MLTTIDRDRFQGPLPSTELGDGAGWAMRAMQSAVKPMGNHDAAEVLAPPANATHHRVAHTLAAIRHSRQITRTDQQQLMEALLSVDRLTPEEKAEVDQIFEGLRLGLVRVVN